MSMFASTSTRTLSPPRRSWRVRWARPSRTSAQTLNRYPDRECVELRQALADYLSQESSAECAVESIWVANGSNEVMSHIMAAFGGPGRVALTFPPTYSMYPEYARESFTTMVSVPRTADFRIDMAASIAAIGPSTPRSCFSPRPTTPPEPP